jgi:hypothetical protein
MEKKKVQPLFGETPKVGKKNPEGKKTSPKKEIKPNSEIKKIDPKKKTVEKKVSQKKEIKPKPEEKKTLAKKIPSPKKEIQPKKVSPVKKTKTSSVKIPPKTKEIEIKEEEETQEVQGIKPSYVKESKRKPKVDKNSPPKTIKHKLKVGDKVVVTFLGQPRTGVIIELSPEGMYKVKTDKGLTLPRAKHEEGEIPDKSYPSYIIKVL